MVTVDATICTRTIALIEQAGRVLVATVPGLDYYFIPGGRVEHGEDARSALEREMQEELGANLQDAQLRAVIDNFFIENGRHVQELGVYFAVKLDIDINSDGILGREETQDMPCHWLDLNDLETTNLKPAILKTILPEILNRKSPGYYVNREW